MTTPLLTIREKALSDMKYFLDESDAILKKVPTTLKNDILLADISRAAAAIFAVIGVGNAIRSIIKRSYFPLRYTGMCGLGIVGIAIFVYFLDRSHKRTKSINQSLVPLNASLKKLSEYWESNTKKEISDFKDLDISRTLYEIDLLHKEYKKQLPVSFPWVYELKDQEKTLQSLNTILVTQDLFRTFIGPDTFVIPRLRKCLPYSTFSEAAKTKIKSIVDFIENNPKFNYQKELTLATLDNFDPEATLKTV